MGLQIEALIIILLELLLQILIPFSKVTGTKACYGYRFFNSDPMLFNIIWQHI